MSQYQAYQNPTPAYGEAQPAQYPQHQPYGQYQPQQPHHQQSFEAQPSKTTFPPSANAERGPAMEHPNPTYKPQQPMSEKPQFDSHIHDHGSDHNLAKPHSSNFGNKWLFGLFDCWSPLDTCCMGYWCPCVLFGRTYARENDEGETSGVGGMCCVWYLTASCGVNSCLQCVTRGSQRKRYGIESSGFNDFCASLCCPCCTLVQEEKESIVRKTGIDPKTKVAYQPIDQGMKYQA